MDRKIAKTNRKVPNSKGTEESPKSNTEFTEKSSKSNWKVTSWILSLFV